MGCRMSRRSASPSPLQSPSTDANRNNGDFHGIGGASPKTKPILGKITNGQSILSRRDTPAGTLLDVVPNKNGSATRTEENSLPLSKPISQIESASQADFFRMLDEKIAQRDDYDDPAEVLRMARLAVKEANSRATRLQNQTTQQLVQRVKDLKYCELQDLKDDNEDLMRYFHKLQTCMTITTEATKCNEACFAVDTNDRVDAALHKEKDVIGDCVKQMREFNGIIEKQKELNEDSKNRLVRDYTLKQEAVNLDHRAAAIGTDPKFMGRRLVNGELEYRDVAPLQRMSEYQEWVENTSVNLNNAAKARTRSRKIVQRLIQTMRELAQAMRQEAINVENTLKDSIRTWTEWRDSLQGQLNSKDKEMKIADAAMNEIQVALSLKGPLQVALMRQTQRGLRPGIELCNDKAQHALEAELKNLRASMLSLEHQLDKAKESRKKLDADRYRLQRKLEICQQNVMIDNEILRQIRATYPQEIQLSGFLIGELPKPIIK